MVSRKVSRSLVLSFVLFANVVSIGCVGYQHKAPLVHANGEALHGAWEDGNDELAVFRGVPFAAPPIAGLRWRAPVANLPRSGPQDATQFAPGCMQTSYTSDWYAGVA